MTLVDDLKAAKALISDPSKWTKGEWESEAGCLCARGAIARAVGARFGSYDVRAAEDALETLIGLPVPIWASKIVYFNDDPTTTHADIMALFDRAIAAAEASAS